MKSRDFKYGGLPFDMQIVADTNVLVGAFLGTGMANAAVAAYLKG